MENNIILPENINIPTKYCLLMYNIINVVAKRGAINADEYYAVGELLEHLKVVLKINEQINANNANNANNTDSNSDFNNNNSDSNSTALP